MKNIGMEYEVYESFLLQKPDFQKGMKRTKRIYSHMHSFANFPQDMKEENLDRSYQNDSKSIDGSESLHHSIQGLKRTKKFYEKLNNYGSFTQK